MPARLNKKVLCFMDEYGTAGMDGFHLGAVLMRARDAGRIDKIFSDLLESSAGEIHASQLDDGYLQGLMQRFWDAAPRDKIVLINQRVARRDGDAAVLYGQAVVETVKVGLKRFRTVLDRETIGNVELILDVNHQNNRPAFDETLMQAKAQDGRFRGVTRFSRIDSSASRLLQLADLVAYSRKWIVSAEMNAKGLKDRFGIQMP